MSSYYEDVNQFGVRPEDLQLGSGSQFATQGGRHRLTQLADEDFLEGGRGGDDGPTGQQNLEFPPMELPGVFVPRFNNLDHWNSLLPPLAPVPPLLPAQSRGGANGGEDMADGLERTPTTEKGDETRRPRRQAQSRQSSEPKSPILACPFYKSDPHRYSDCKTFVLRRVKDIKQHINRKHKLPDIYCPRCYREFGSTEESAEHQRSQARQPCEPRDMPGINARQKVQFSQYRSRGKEIEEQWYDLWNIVFPGRQKPDSIYVNHRREGRIRMLRRIWDDRKSEIMGNTLNTTSSHTSDTLDQSVIDRVVNTFLNHVETEMLDVDTTESDLTIGEPLELQVTQIQARTQPKLEESRETYVENQIPELYDLFHVPNPPSVITPMGTLRDFDQDIDSLIHFPPRSPHL